MIGRVSHPDRHHGGGISVTTLIIASAASAAAAFVVSRVWGAGTLIGAAVTPVIVAIVTELLRKPATKLPEIVASGNGRATAKTLPGDVPASIPGPDEAPLVEQVPVEPPMRVYRARPEPRLGPREWRLVALTGLAAFVIGIGVYVGVDRLAGGEGRLVPDRRATPATTVTTEGAQTTTVVTEQQQTITSETVTVQRERTVTVPAEPEVETAPSTATTQTTPPTQTAEPQVEDPAAVP